MSYGEHAGSSGPLRGGKLTTFEGGVRVPFMIKWPERISQGRVCHELTTSMDLLPTICEIIESEYPERRIDGKDIRSLLFGNSQSVTPHESFYYYAGSELHAIRSGDWKLHFPHPYLEVAGSPGRAGKPANFENLSPDAITESGLKGIASRHGYRIKYTSLELYNIVDDINESVNLADQYPQEIERLESLAEIARLDLGDSHTGRTGENIRISGQAESHDQ